jgi:hypothetical protein
MPDRSAGESASTIRRDAAALAVAIAGAIAGCSGSSGATSDAAPTSEPSITPSASPSPTDAAGSGQTTARCTLKGSVKSIQVTLRQTSDGLTLSFDGYRVTSTGDVFLSAMVFDDSDNGVQLGMGWLDGRQNDYSVFDFGTAQQANLPGEPAITGDTITGTFPAEELGAVAENGPASWSAALSLEGEDVALCPSDPGKFQPFAR